MGITFHKQFVLLFSLLSCFSLSGKAQDLNPKADSAYKNSTIFLPALGSSPETSFLFGGVAVFQFKPKNTGAETRPSSIVATAVYTLNEQISLGFSPYLVTKNEEWIFAGGINYNYFPESYWGVGAKTKNSDEVRMLYRQFLIDQSALKKIQEDLFIGPRLRFNKTYDMAFEDLNGIRIPYPIETGAKDYTAVGIGLMMRLDKSNSIITPIENYSVELSFLTNPEFLGSTSNFSSVTLNVRRYFNFKTEGRTVLALQALTKFTAGKTPLREMAMLGGESILRGYYGGRYRDNNSAQFQAELRQSIIGRFGITAFVAAGEVWHSFDDINRINPKVTAGGGLRINLNKNDTMNLRIDYGLGSKTSGFYLTLGEAF